MIQSTLGTINLSINTLIFNVMDTQKSVGSIGGPSNQRGSGSSFNGKRGLVAQNSIQAENIRKDKDHPGFEDMSTGSTTKKEHESSPKSRARSNAEKADDAEGQHHADKE